MGITQTKLTFADVRHGFTNTAIRADLIASGVSTVAILLATLLGSGPLALGVVLTVLAVANGVRALIPAIQAHRDYRDFDAYIGDMMTQEYRYYEDDTAYNALVSEGPATGPIAGPLPAP